LSIPATVSQLRKVQQDTNEFLTGVITSRGEGSNGDNNTVNGNYEDEDEVDDEEEEDDSDAKEPEEKIPKLL
jgi:hypothetical protein